jgi:putative ABC transport system permease protein
LLGVLTALAAQALAAPLLQRRLGITLQMGAPEVTQWAVLAAVLVAGMLASLLPAWRAYSLSLADGLSPRL